MSGADLRSGKSKSCGCLKGERTAERNFKHGGAGTRLYTIWKGMRRRCQDPKHPQFPDYGGRGIAVCPEWDTFDQFRSWAVTCGYDDLLSIERVDVNGGYEPSNCIWADAAQQSANRRFVAKDADGVLWLHRARANGITDAAYRSRLYEGWPLKVAATWPMHKRRAPYIRDAQGRFI